MLSIWEYFYTPWPPVPQTLSAGLTLTTTGGGGQGISKNYALQLVGTASFSYTGLAITTGGTSLTLPAFATSTGINFVYIKNTGNFPVTTTWTPFNGASNIVKTIQPGGFIFEGDSALGSGVTAISLQAVGGNSTIECVLFG